jgi:hypothetical protein
MDQNIKIVNKELPKGFRKYWDNFNAKAYKKYLKAKEDWRIKKMKQQN